MGYGFVSILYIVLSFSASGCLEQPCPLNPFFRLEGCDFSTDEVLTLIPPKILSLEQAIDFIDADELLEVTPESLRIRKRF